jgi:hypothetical protein
MTLDVINVVSVAHYLNFYPSDIVFLSEAVDFTSVLSPSDFLALVAA